MSFEVILLTILVFFVLVGIHEFGHFYFAKRAGILVREFAIGFGPKVFSFRKGETKYTLRLLPIGGFVRMAGEDPETIEIQPGQTIAVQVQHGQVSHIYVDKVDLRSSVIQGEVQKIDLEHSLTMDLVTGGTVERFAVNPKAVIVAKEAENQIAPRNRQFVGKTVGQRAMAIFAGPLMNFILALFLFAIFVMVHGVATGEKPTELYMQRIVPGSPAEKAGFQEKDVVTMINGEAIGIDYERLRELIQQSPDKAMEWEVLRNGEPVVIQVTPEQKEGRPMIGVEFNADIPTRAPTVKEVFTQTGQEMKFWTEQIFVGLKKLVTFEVKMEELGGPVDIVNQTSQAAKFGIDILIRWSAILSLYLGIFNLLPFPALDGSRLLFIGIEAVRGKPIDPNRESMVHFIGFAMLMLLMVVVTYHDLLALFKQ